MTTPFEPTYAPVTHAVTPFGHDHYVIVWQYVRTTSNRHPKDTKSPPLVKYKERIVLSAFDFKPPYAMNCHIFLAPYGEWFTLIGRVPISAKEEDGCSMDYRAVLVHTCRNREVKVTIPVPDIFFEENFTPPLPSTPLPSLPPPAHHLYPPLPPHIDAQLGQTGSSVARHQATRKNWIRRYWVHVLSLSLSIVILGSLVIASTFH
ncbi:hypothetical protein M422DRAFT_254403 [Sphaerobolus stellatus SS14]|uniref:Unplaced genomic scaffold SPHSTscaffold_55, whole genome shotgun sequence n=1 Tax=Sphaerobolus stellatus (strain SS14) TaxID=990650 RepID=A0A0C9VKV6_SPHS4|nr:hypothetical protein M422DRAFT_254403 [Sphaerobolus stellatus SS14]